MSQDPHEQVAPGVGVVDPGGDVHTHRMRGEAAQAARGRGYFDVPLITRAYGRDEDPAWPGELWQGGCIDDVRLPHDFDYVLSLYPWEKYVIGPGTERDEVEMYDSLGQDTSAASALADSVVGRLRSGQKVLIHCQAGLNRSGLMTATVLVKLGFSPREAIDRLRQQRTEVVLCNRTFEDAVLAMGPAQRYEVRPGSEGSRSGYRIFDTKHDVFVGLDHGALRGVEDPEAFHEDYEEAEHWAASLNAVEDAS